MRKDIENLPLPEGPQKVLKQLPAYWMMLSNSRSSRKLLVARLRSAVFAVEGLEDHVRKLQDRIKGLHKAQLVLLDEIAMLRGRKLARHYEEMAALEAQMRAAEEREAEALKAFWREADSETRESKEAQRRREISQRRAP